MNKTGHHQEAPSGEHHSHSYYWQRAHRDWRLWVAVVLMFGAMIIYLTTEDLAWRPRLRPQAPLPNAVGQ
jgi:hypothetical protein